MVQIKKRGHNLWPEYRKLNYSLIYDEATNLLESLRFHCSKQSGYFTYEKQKNDRGKKRPASASTHTGFSQNVVLENNFYGTFDDCTVDRV